MGALPVSTVTKRRWPIYGHYEFVSEKFGIDPDAIHSWRGDSPAVLKEAARDPNHWSNTVFNPQFLRTPGARIRPAICWMVLDHTVKVDGVALWETGRLRQTR